MWYTCACFRFLDKRRFRRWYQRNVVYCRLLQKGCEKLVTGWELLQLLTKLHCFFQQNCWLRPKIALDIWRAWKAGANHPQPPAHQAVLLWTGFPSFYWRPVGALVFSLCLDHWCCCLTDNVLGILVVTQKISKFFLKLKVKGSDRNKVLKTLFA